MLDHVQRFSEQMVLCVKAAIVIADGCKRYSIENALSSIESSDNHKNGNTLNLLYYLISHYSTQYYQRQRNWNQYVLIRHRYLENYITNV